MAKRFTDTEKWKKGLMKSLPAAYKLFWLYVCDDCDHAGIWHVDVEVASLRMGAKVDKTKIEKMFKDKIKIFDNGEKWFIPSFIEFQYPSGLNPANRTHNSVINILKKYNLLKELTSPLQGAKDKYKDMEMDKDRSIEDCLKIALFDERWARANKTDGSELATFNGYLERLGKYEMNPLDYKQYFAKLKGRYPDMIKRELSIDELRAMAEKLDKEAA